MIAATHYDNLLVFVFFGIAILFQILSRATSKGRKKPTDTRRRSTSPPQTSRPLPREADDEDQIRKFLEALGQPTTSKPPPAVEPRPTYQRPLTHVPPFGSPLPPLKTRPPDLPTETASTESVIRKREAKTIRPKVAETPAFEVHQGPPPLEPIPEAAQKSAKPRDLVAMLRSTSGLRDAIILREIFGPPRSMQPLDLVGSV